MYISTNSAKEYLSKNLEEVSHKEDSGAYFVFSSIDANSSQKDGEFQEILCHLPKAFNISLPGEDQYKEDVYHWANSSSQDSECTVQPVTVQDVSDILKLFNKHRIPFGVKSGGHTGNPGFSSSRGVLISMKRFDQVVYQPESQTAVIGAGQIWDNVYEKLAQHNVTVLGARVTHIGVAGFILGGGYSWKTNQYGLAIDTVTAFELVKPDGTIVNVTEASDSELFFALRGGGNNFGIVTNFTMKTFSQGPVWGGPVLYMNLLDDPERDETMKKLFFAVQTFIDKVTDPKAAILVSLGTLSGFLGDTKLLNIIAFYDGPLPPAGIFDIFKEIAPKETAKWKTRDYLDLVKTAMCYDDSRGSRGTFHTVGLSHYTHNILEEIWKENEYWRSNLTSEATSRFLLSYSVEPFLPDILSHGSPSAYPSNRSVAFSPFPVYISWNESKFDAQLQEFAKTATQRIEEAAKKDGITIGARYPNYALFDTPLEEMYGENVEKLKKIKAKVDPSNVMGLTGGFKF